MGFFHSMISTVLFIFHSYDLSSQFGCSPDNAPIPGFSRADPSAPTSHTRNPLVGPHSSTSSPPHAEPPLRLRSRSPSAVIGTPSTTRLPPLSVLGYGLDQLGSIRLIPYKNPQRRFALRRYTFHTDKSIELLKGSNEYGPIPNQKQIVLSTFDEDVFAILDSAYTLAGIYTYDLRIPPKVRAKINMKSGVVTPLTTDEIKQTPVGPHRQLLHGYRVEHSNHNQSTLASAGSSVGASSSPISRHMSPPTSVLCSDGSEYGLDQLQFIRLIPNKNPNHTFELQEYTFPADKLISFCLGSNRFRPMPIQEVIVLKTNAVDVFAVLEKNNRLAGIYTYDSLMHAYVRAKMNMRNDTVVQLTKHEIREVPVGRLRSILNHFKIEHLSHNSSSLLDY